MRCSNCGADNRTERKFCAACGAKLAVSCPVCGAVNLPGERFCGECGAQLGAAGGGPGTAPVGDVTADATQSTQPGAASSPAEHRPTAGAPAPAAGSVSERRLVSVLFTDLVDFTALAETLDIEEVRDLQSAYFETARQVMERYGGTVEKYIGDAVMAVWGYPTAFEDDAERAVRAGLDVVEAVGELGSRHRIENLAARAAVATGEAAVTLGAVGEGMVTGDLVNTAARLQSAAAPGSVLAGEATVHASEAAIAFEPAGERDLKGKALPVPAWRALRIVAGRLGAGRADRLEAPFVGRGPELRALKDALEATGREQRAHFAWLTGQGGIGKSRLAWELEKYVDGLVEVVYWHRGRSPAYGEGVAYWALGEMVRERARIAEADGPAETAAKLGAMLDEYVADQAERTWVEPHLRVLLGLDASAGGDRTEQFAAWRRLFEVISERGTTVLVFEDLQWADDGQLDFIDSLFEWSRARPILVVALARPELVERRPTLGQASRSAITLHLEPLADDDMRALLQGLGLELSPSLVDAVVTRAEGIPLFAIELVRMLRGPDGTISASVEASGLAIPPTLQALVAARLDALDAGDRALLQEASVLGQSFTAPALAEVGSQPLTDLEPRLRSLVRREFLVVDADPRSPERGQYGWVQSVVREVAYGTLGRRDRRARHLAAARHYESLGDEEVAPVLASHYLEAYRAAPDDEQAAAIRAQARVALRAAADRAARVHNYDQAVRDLGHALEISEEAAERAALLIRQAELAEAGARYEEAADAAGQARDAFGSLDDASAAGRATAILGRIELKRGHVDGAQRLLEEGLAGLDPRADPDTYARMASELARAHMLADRMTEAMTWTERALEAAGEPRLVEVIAEALNTRGVALQHVGRLDEGIALIRASIELAAAHRLANAELRASYNLAGRIFSDDPRGGIAVLASALDLATRTGRRDWQAAAGGFLAGLLADVGDWAESRDVLDRVVDGRTPPGDQAEALLLGAQIAAGLGDRDAWPRAIAEAQRLTEGDTNLIRIGQGIARAATVALWEGRLADVEAEGRLASEGSNWSGWVVITRLQAAILRWDPRSARALADAPDLVPIAQTNANGHYVAATLASLAILEGRREEGLAELREAIRALRAFDVPLWIAWNEVLAVAALGANDPETEPLATEARSIFEAMGARALLDRLDEALAGGDRAASRPTPAQPADADPAVWGGGTVQG